MLLRSLWILLWIAAIPTTALASENQTRLGQVREKAYQRLLGLMMEPHLIPRHSGEAAVRKAVNFVRNISLAAGLADISLFLVRIAKIESCYGTNRLTYRSGYYGGIWQVDRIGFEDTKNVGSHPALARILSVVDHFLSKATGKPVKWSNLPWNSCLIPAYSCIAARLYLANKAEPVPRSLEAQAIYWKKHYNTEAGDGNEERFAQDADL